MKKCPDCKEPKSEDQYYKCAGRPDGYQTYCKEHTKIRSKNYQKNWYQKNKEAIVQSSKAYYIVNKKHCREKAKQRYYADVCTSRAYYNDYQRTKLTPEKKKQRSESNKKWRLSPEKAAVVNHACTIKNSFKKYIEGNYKWSFAENHLCCDLENFKIYIHNILEPGMEWSNYGEWILTHIIPYTTNHYTNFTVKWKKLPCL